MKQTPPPGPLALLLVLGCMLAVAGILIAATGAGATSSLQRTTPEPVGESDPAQDPVDPVLLPLMLNNASGSISESEIREGHATFYAATGAGSCMFDPTPNDLMVGAMNHVDYDNAAMCGAYVEVTGPEDVVVIRIVDVCPDDICVSGHIDLSAEAFDRIAEPSDGYVPITWRIVSPELDGPVVYHFKDGSNPYWTAVQVRNHRNPVAQFEYLDSSGQFKRLERRTYNYFVEEAGMGEGPYTFRITDIYGNILTDSGIAFVEDGDVPGQSQFPAP